MPRPELPIEIQEHILDHLYDDPPTLRACCLTCSTWVPTTRLHIFRVVKLRNTRDCLRFLSTLESTSEAHGGGGVGALIRELKLPTMQLCQEDRKKGMRLDLVCQILRRLPNVEVLVMERFDWRSLAESLIPDDSGVSLVHAIRSVFPFPRLSRLLLRSIIIRSPSEVLQFISAFPSLAFLELSGITAGLGIGDPFATIPHCKSVRIRIQEVVVDRWTSSSATLDQILKGLLKPPFDPRPRRLQWKCSDGMGYSSDSNESALTKLFRRAEETLEEFEVNFERDGWLRKNEISRHRSLTVLTLTFRFSLYHPNFWPSIPAFISQINSSGLREVKLQFEDLYSRFHWKFVIWKEMTDALLSLHERYPFATVTFTFSFHAAYRDMPSVVGPLKALIERVIEAQMRVSVVHTRLVRVDIKTGSYDAHAIAEFSGLRESLRRAPYEDPVAKSVSRMSIAAQFYGLPELVRASTTESAQEFTPKLVPKTCSFDTVMTITFDDAGKIAHWQDCPSEGIPDGGSRLAEWMREKQSELTKAVLSLPKDEEEDLERWRNWYGDAAPR
ncbi:uncharacterized protein B0H18DRAFT_1212289 [Fomitopsis serialis]|uniref:uncharacterized protein n=1 Tax=Fomitopsis serialis TaxID=139415 RepID=UPI002007F47D|nr:uncharacterized protein B0H18DRAFT_1212289 [Neoantrodia serialis]KAH9923253.1 hypothetical protein B0H18DRAFT_1212289 [Neoantrodia serialis]